MTLLAVSLSVPHPYLLRILTKLSATAERPPNIYLLRWTPEWRYWQVTRPLVGGP